MDSNTKLLLHCEGNGDEAGNTVTATGSVALETTASPFAKRLRFQGAGGRLTIPNAVAWNLPGDFTVDWRMAMDANQSVRIFERSDGPNWVGLQFVPGTGWDFQVYANAALVFRATFAWAWAAGEKHFAFVRRGSAWRFFVEGQQVGGTVTSAVNLPAMAAALILFSASNGTIPLIGTADEFRIKNVAEWTANFTPPVEPYAAPPLPEPPVVGAAENEIWADRCACLEPDATQYLSGAAFAIPTTEPLYLLNGWQLTPAGDTGKKWFHRENGAVVLPQGSSFGFDGSVTPQYAYAYWVKPSLVNTDPRYQNARDLYHQRLKRLKTLPVHNLTANIAQGQTATQATAAGTLVENFPADFERGLITHVSVHDASWGTIEQAGSNPAVIINLLVELDDIRPHRFTSPVYIPFKRSLFPQLRCGFGSMFWSNNPGHANDPIQPIIAGTQTYPGSVTVHYVKLDGDLPDGLGPW
jgi:hypothetical protein